MCFLSGEAIVLFKVLSVLSVETHNSLPWEISAVVVEIQEGLSSVNRGGQDC